MSGPAPGEEDTNDEINLDQLKELKRIFEAADDDGSGELDIDEFTDKLGPHLGGKLTNAQIRQLFMKIDADAGGTVDWEEFTNYMFLERAQEQAGASSENWRLFPQDFRDKNDIGVAHRGPVDKILYCEPIDKYITCSRDGTFRLWNGMDLKHVKTLSMGSSWITDCIFMPQARKLVFTTVDRAVSYYETNRGSYDLSGRVYASGGMGVPQALTIVSNDSGEQVVYGDSKGHVVMLLCGTKEWPARDLISTEEHQDYIYIHQDHTDWVSQCTWVPEIGLVSSSIDSSIKIFDFTREKVIHTCNQHQKAVHGFVWCSAYTLFASCGVERDIMLWQGNTCRRVGELTGHTASVTHLAVDERLNHVFSLSADKVIKVWDLRNHKCLQTLTQDDWMKREEARPHCLMYDSIHKRVVTAMQKPHVWCHKMVAEDRTGHMESVCGALYNSVFDVIVSADESGTVCVWNIADGTREGRFLKVHDSARLTAMCFDKNERRLLTAGGDGTVYMWNFNNGSKLREYAHGEEELEIVTVLFASDEKRESTAVYAAGWNAKVFVWEDLDDDDDVLRNYRLFDGHREDITNMAAYAQRALLATGDYEGRITIWQLFTGEKRMCLFHRAERYETSIERMLWMPLKGTGASSRASTPSTFHSGPASVGGGRASTTGTGGRPTGDGRGEEEEEPEEKEAWREDASLVSNANPMLLLSCGGDGLMRVWVVGSVGKLVCTMPAAQGKLESVSGIKADKDFNSVVIADTAGHIRVWDVSGGVDVSSPEACSRSFRQRCHWRARHAAINSIDIVPGHNLIIAGCKDFTVTLWTLDGGCLGSLGDDVWKIDDKRTWTDPDGSERERILNPTDTLYLQAGVTGNNDDEDEDNEEGGSGGGGGTKSSERRGGGKRGGGRAASEAVELACVLASERQAKAREASILKPMGLHSNLHLHGLQPVPGNVRALLAGDSRGGGASSSIVKSSSAGGSNVASASATDAKMDAAYLSRGGKPPNPLARR
ncbi:hypothetical protein FOA52_004666 [Chlamydomonas sp. UWO 241]|nr:hypothetical protein FOA52_004666 [Chlamydomonas sp. UWO 241]